MINATVHLMSGPLELTIYSNGGIEVMMFGRYTAIHSEDEGQPAISGNADSVQDAVDDLLAFGVHP